MKIHYLLLGIVLMISGLEVTAQEDYHAQICIEGEYSEQDFETIDEPNSEWFDFYVATNQNEKFRVYIWHEGEMVQGWWLGECEFGELDSTPEEQQEKSDRELAMITWIHEAGRRGVWDGVFGRDGD